MKKRKIAVGPGASSLILIAVMVALSVLTVLTMISARSDEAMTRRSAETREEVYALFARGEESLARLDAALVSCMAETPGDRDACLAAVAERLPDGMKMNGDRVQWTERTDTRTLECAVRLLPGGGRKRIEWISHRLNAGEIWEEDEFRDDEEDSENETAGREDGGAPETERGEEEFE